MSFDAAITSFGIRNFDKLKVFRGLSGIEIKKICDFGNEQPQTPIIKQGSTLHSR